MRRMANGTNPLEDAINIALGLGKMVFFVLVFLAALRILGLL